MLGGGRLTSHDFFQEDPCEPGSINSLVLGDGMFSHLE